MILLSNFSDIRNACAVLGVSNHCVPNLLFINNARNRCAERT